MKPKDRSKGLLPELPSSAGEVIDIYSEYYLNQSDDEPKNGAVKVTFYGTPMLLFDDGETQLIVDPFISHPSRKDISGESHNCVNHF